MNLPTTFDPVEYTREVENAAREAVRIEDRKHCDIEGGEETGLPDHFQQRQRAGNFVAMDARGEIEMRRCAVALRRDALEPRNCSGGL